MDNNIPIIPCASPKYGVISTKELDERIKNAKSILDKYLKRDTMTDLSSFTIFELEGELARRKELESNECRLRLLLAGMSESDLEFIEEIIKRDPYYLKKQISLSLSSRYDP